MYVHNTYTRSYINYQVIFLPTSQDFFIVDYFFSYQYDENALNVCVIYFVIDLTKVTWDPCPSKMNKCQLLSVKSKHGIILLSSMLVLHTHSDPYLTFFYVIAHATMGSKNVETRNICFSCIDTCKDWDPLACLWNQSIYIMWIIFLQEPFLHYYDQLGHMIHHNCIYVIWTQLYLSYDSFRFLQNEKQLSWLNVFIQPQVLGLFTTIDLDATS
jgi:hypothetical protein